MPKVIVAGVSASHTSNALIAVAIRMPPKRSLSGVALLENDLLRQATTKDLFLRELVEVVLDRGFMSFKS